MKMINDHDYFAAFLEEKITEKHLELLRRFSKTESECMIEDIINFYNLCTKISKLAGALCLQSVVAVCDRLCWEWFRRQQADGFDLNEYINNDYHVPINNDQLVREIFNALDLQYTENIAPTKQRNRELIIAIDPWHLNQNLDGFKNYLKELISRPSEIKGVATFLVSILFLNNSSHIKDEKINETWQLVKKLSRESYNEGNHQALILPLYYLRQYAIFLSKKEEWRKSDTMLFAGIETHSVGNLAKKLGSLCIKNNIQELRPAESAFPEDKLFSSALAEIFSKNNLLAIRPKYVNWGSAPSDIDLQLHNDLSIVQNHKTGNNISVSNSEINKIFSHTGYYLLVNKLKLEELTHKKKLPPEIKKVAKSMLNNSSFQLSINEKNIIPLCYIALALGLPKYNSSEYAIVYEGIFNLVNKKYNASSVIDHNKPQIINNFGEHLREFMQEQVGVFWGGSIHARLLERWWPEEIMIFLKPDHFSFILNHMDPKIKKNVPWPLFNRLSISQSLVRALNEDADKFYLTAMSLYKQIGSNLKAEATRARAAAINYRINLKNRNFEIETQEAILMIRKWMSVLITENPSGTHIDDDSRLWVVFYLPS